MQLFKRVNDLIASLLLKPLHFYRSIKKGEIKSIFKEHILGARDSNLKMATAIGFGIFMGIFPIWGFQMLAAIFLAAFFRLNKAIVLIAANISIPPLIPFLLYLSFLLGGLLLNQSTSINFNPQFDLENIQSNVFQYYIGAVFFASLAGLFGGVFSYLILFIFRRDINNKAELRE